MDEYTMTTSDGLVWVEKYRWIAIHYYGYRASENAYDGITQRVSADIFDTPEEALQAAPKTDHNVFNPKQEISVICFWQKKD